MGYGWEGQFNPNGTSQTDYRWSDPTHCNCYVPGTVNLALNGPDFLSQVSTAATPVNPNLKLAYTNEYSVALEHELGMSMSVRLLYLYKNYVGNERLVNTLIPYSGYSVPITATIKAPNGAPGPAGDTITYYDFNPAYHGSAFQNSELVNATTRTDHYNNYEARLEKRMSNNWFALTSFVVTKNHRWLVGVVQNPNDNLFPIDDTYIWSYRLAGGFYLPGKVLLSTTTDIDNGFKGQRTEVFPAPQSGTLTLRVDPFGSDNGPTRAISNLRLSKEFSLGGSRRLGLEINVFNVFNTNVAFTETQVTGPTFGYITDYVGPRAARLGGSFSF